MYTLLRQMAVELVGRGMTDSVRVYSVQLLRVESHFNLTLLITVVAEDRNKDGIAELIRKNILRPDLFHKRFTVADVRRYGERSEVMVDL